MKIKLSLSIIAAMMAITASAQHWRLPNAVAATYNYATEYHQHGLGAKLQLGITGPWRLEPEIIYFAQSNKVTTLQLNANLHYVRPITQALGLYPFAGVTYSHWGYEGPDRSRWGANLGAGLEIYLGRRWGAFGEFRFMLVKQETQAVTTLGLKHYF